MSNKPQTILSTFAVIVLLLALNIACEKKDVHNEVQIVTIKVGETFPTNCYLVWNEYSNEALVIDPGFEHKRIIRAIEKYGLRIKYIVHTHGHYDHTSESNLLQKATGAKVCIHPKQIQYNRITPPLKIEEKHIIKINNGETIDLEYMSFTVIHTPGHSPGSICLYRSGVLFTGDLLFKNTVGRSDLAGGNNNEISVSLTKRLKYIPDGTTVYPGHGEKTNMGLERKTNPFILGAYK